MDVYGRILDGINTKKASTITSEDYLQSLKPHVRFLRKAYFAKPVVVPYEKPHIQDSYLLTYFPHYYQLLYKIILEEVPGFFKNRKSISVSFIGGGPGSEIYGLIKYIANNARHIGQVNVHLFDINAETWKHSHAIIEDGLLRTTLQAGASIKWDSYYLDISKIETLDKFKKTFSESDIVVVQNCLNEISTKLISQAEANIIQVFEWLGPQGLLILADMTSGARDVLKSIEGKIVSKFKPSFHKTTLNSYSSGSLISVHHIPSLLVRRHLLTGEDGLIPRKYIKYDYTILGKQYDGKESQTQSLGFNSLYGPLNFSYLDINDHISKKVFIGIDFGTSTTTLCAAYVDGGRLEIEPLAIPQKGKDGSVKVERLVPGVVSKVGSTLMVGYYAALYKPTLTYGVDSWHSFKANLGIMDKISYPQSALKDHPKKRINNMRDALGIFLEYLHRELSKIINDKFPGKEPMYALSVPVGFGSREKLHLKSIMTEAGFDCKDVPFIEEPNAAMIHYFFATNTNVDSNTPLNYLIIDIGAGTVDLSIVEIEKKGNEIVSTLLSVHRNGQQGGNWIDAKISELIINENELKSKISEQESQSLLANCEQLKILLCKTLNTDRSVKFALDQISKSEAKVALPNAFETDEGKKFLIGITYQFFNQLMKEYWLGSRDFIGVKESIEECLKAGALNADKIYKAIVTGGGARNPYMKSYLAKYFGAGKLFFVDDTQEQVARGTALHSFIVNSFGKPIITSLLNTNYYVEIDGVRKKLFSKGDGYPTHDMDIFFANKQLTSSKINVYISDSPAFIKTFVVPEPGSVTQLVFYIDPDQELRCEIVTNGDSLPAKETYV